MAVINIPKRRYAALRKLSELPDLQFDAVVKALNEISPGSSHEPTALESEFNGLLDQWKKETYFHSSLGRLFTHPAYLRIIGMGKAAIPFVLKDLEKNPTRWFYALKFMAGEDAAEGARNFEEARMMWLEWGRKHL